MTNYPYNYQYLKCYDMKTRNYIYYKVMFGKVQKIGNSFFFGNGPCDMIFVRECKRVLYKRNDTISINDVNNDKATKEINIYELHVNKASINLFFDKLIILETYNSSTIIEDAK